MNKIRNWGAATLATLTLPAFAAVPADFTQAVTDMKADGVAMGGALVGVAAAVGVALLAVAYVKKIRGAAK